MNEEEPRRLDFIILIDGTKIRAAKSSIDRDDFVLLEQPLVEIITERPEGKSEVKDFNPWGGNIRIQKCQIKFWSRGIEDRPLSEEESKPE